jgi:hypothetical protein
MPYFLTLRTQNYKKFIEQKKGLPVSFRINKKQDYNQPEYLRRKFMFLNGRLGEDMLVNKVSFLRNFSFF